eukprot:scaffold114_cov200-Alexandrium_tamarense.AAC.86
MDNFDNADQQRRNMDFDARFNINQQLQQPQQQQQNKHPNLQPLWHQWKTTDDSHKLKTNQFLLENASRLDDAIIELSMYASILSEDNSDDANHNNNKRIQRLEALQHIQQTIIPLLYISADTLRNAGMTLAPMPGTKPLHKRQEANRRRELNLGVGADARRRRLEKRTTLQMIEAFVAKSEVDLSKIGTRAKGRDAVVDTGGVAHIAAAASSTTTESAVEKPTTTTIDPLPKKLTIRLPPPRNGQYYTKPEAVYAIRLFPKNTMERGNAVKAMMANGLVPASARTLQRFVLMAENGQTVPNTKWSKGRPRTSDEYDGEEPPFKPWDSSEGTEMISLEVCPDSDKTKNKEAVRNEKGEEIVEVNGIVTNTKTKYSVFRLRVSPGRLGISVDFKEGRSGAFVSAIDSNCAFKDKICVGDIIMESNDKKVTRVQDLSEDAGVTRILAIVRPAAKGPKTKKGGKSTGKLSACKKSASGKHDTPTERRGRKKQSEEDVANFEIPVPANGTTYTQPEAVTIIKQYKKSSAQRSLAMKAMIARSYVPHSIRSLHRLLKREEEGQPVLDVAWNELGQPSFLKDADIDAIVERIKEQNSKISGGDVEAMVIEAARAKRRRVSSAGEGDDAGEERRKISTASLKNYVAIFKSKLPDFYWEGEES